MPAPAHHPIRRTRTRRGGRLPLEPRRLHAPLVLGPADDRRALTHGLSLATFADVDGFKPAELMEDDSSIPLDIARFAAAAA